jgi:alpha-tubulin suppressor-like RCC1 family protein
LAAGEDHACVVVTGATVKCWGLNNAGQVGNGSDAGGSVSRPTRVIGLSGVAAVAAGDNHSCALLKVGTVKCWGLNDAGELGDGTTISVAAPVDVKAVSGRGLLRDVSAIAAAQDHSCALLRAGTVVCWGQNQYGVLGNGTTKNSATPVAVTGLTQVSAISTGNQDSCALLHTRAVKCWGYNGDGELGEGITNGPQSCAFGDFNASCSTTPVAVKWVTAAAALSVRSNSVCALVTAATVTCWGVTPTSVAGLSGVTAISSGGAPYGEDTCVLLKTGTAKCWGYNQDGELGNGTRANTTVPLSVAGLRNATTIAAGGVFTCAGLAGGGTECWGNNTYGQLGGPGPNRLEPIHVAGL